jgi:hypothetical protein
METAGKRDLLRRHRQRIRMECIYDFAKSRGVELVRRVDPGAVVTWYAKAGPGPAAMVGSTAALLAVLSPAVSGGASVQRRVVCETVRSMQVQALHALAGPGKTPEGR